MSNNMKHETLPVKGMHCASCSAVIKRSLGKLPGVDSCEINVGTEKATISYNPEQTSIDEMNQKIDKLGYSLIKPQAQEHAEHMDHSEHSEHAEHLGLNQSKEEKLKQLAELKTKVEFVVPITVLTFIFMMWDILAQNISWVPNLPIPMQLFNTILFLLAAVVLFWIGKPFIDGVVRFAKHRVANMDSLIGIGTATAFLYSSIIFLLPAVRELMQAPEYTYFDVTIVVIGFVVLGKYLEARSKLKTGEAIEKLIGLQAKSATVIRDGKEIEIPIEEVVVGDLILVKPGQKIPVDGVIIKGESAIDESMITGEPIPVDKKIDDVVIGATINKQGSLTVRATQIGNDTMLAQIIRMVEEAQSSKAPIEKLADQVSAIFVPAVLIFAVVMLLVWLVVGSQFMPFSQALTLGIVSFVGILVIACPCAMGLATPTAVIVGVGKAAQHGILIKNAENLEKLNAVNVVVMDKTGTITKGAPEVTDINPVGKISVKDVLQLLASLENMSEHPLAKAMVDKAIKEKVKLLSVEKFAAIEGKGLKGSINGIEYYAGNVTLAKDLGIKIEPTTINMFSSQGKTPVILMTKENVIAYMGIADTIKDDAKAAIHKLHQQGMQVVVLTGDNQQTAEYIAKQVGVDRVIAQVLPGEKADEIKKLQGDGFVVAMVGDGINDAPALASADVGIAMGTGTDIAIESAGITLLGGHIAKLPQAVTMARATMNTVKQNLFWAFFYNIVGIPVAAGVLYPLFGILLNPAIAGAAMAFSSVSVVLNALRLKTVRLE
jgi:P-type Cu+ transporter